MKKYNSPTIESIGGRDGGVEPQSLIKMGYALLVAAGAVALAVAVAGPVVAYNWKWTWCDPVKQ